eukprot:15324566-Ditylum_brightwellii.AAC.2
MAIFDVAIVKPHQMFAGKSHMLHKNCDEWKSYVPLCHIADEIYRALEKLEKDPAKFVDQEFMLSIFDHWNDIVPEVKDWWGYIYVDGKSPTRNNKYPTMIATHKETLQLGLKAVVHFMEEMLSKKQGKGTRQFMSAVKGAMSWEMMLQEDKDAGQ